MDINGKGITQTDLNLLPEPNNNVVLWQPDVAAPPYVTDNDGYRWVIGFYKGVLSKRKCGEG